MSNFQFDADPNATVQVGHVIITRTKITYLGLHHLKKKNITSTVPGASKLGTPTPKKTQNKFGNSQELKPTNPSNNQSICAFLFEAIWNQPTQPQKKHPPPTKTELRIDPQGCRVTLKLHPFIWKMVRVTDPDITLEAITLQALQKLHLSESPFWKNTRFLHTQLEAFTQLWLKFLEHLISFQLLPGVWKKSHDVSISLWQFGIIYPDKSYIDPITNQRTCGWTWPIHWFYGLWEYVQSCVFWVQLLFVEFSVRLGRSHGNTWCFIFQILFRFFLRLCNKGSIDFVDPTHQRCNVSRFVCVCVWQTEYLNRRILLQQI